MHLEMLCWRHQACLLAADQDKWEASLSVWCDVSQPSPPSQQRPSVLPSSHQPQSIHLPINSLCGLCVRVVGAARDCRRELRNLYATYATCIDRSQI